MLGSLLDIGTMTHDEFLESIEQFLSESQMSPSRFGLDAMGDPSFVRQVREGRSCGLRIVERVQEFMDANRVQGAAQ